MPTETAMTSPINKQELARRNVRMALIHLALALGLLAAFVWSVSHR
jgi:CHASE3 domain sensor protein